MADDPWEKALNAFEYAYWRGIPKLLNNDGFVLAFICCLAATEALAGYRYPSVSGNGDRFRRFICEYFPSHWSKSSPDLWQFRNGLIHGFTVGPRFKIGHVMPEAHFCVDAEDGKTILTAEEFFREVREAAWKYFHELEANPEVQAAFWQRIRTHDDDAMFFTPFS